MNEIRATGTVVVALFGCLFGGCANQVGQADPQGWNGGSGSSAFELRVERYRYLGEELSATIEMRPEGERVLDGPDNARLSSLMATPGSGILVDPGEDNLSWIYTSSAERDAVMTQAHVRVPLKRVDSTPPAAVRARSGSLRTLALSSGGCLFSGTTLFENNNYGGASFSFSGAPRDLRDFNFDNKTSSLTYVSGDVTLYENPVWGGHSISFVPNLEVRLSTCPVSQPYGEYPSLSGRTMSTSFWFWTTSWDNQASSASYQPWQYP